jgi:hypothetical protein
VTQPNAPSSGDPTIVGLLSRKARMTEGQLYTVVLVALAVLLLTLTGLPNAHRRDRTDTPAVTAPTGANHLPSVADADDPSTPILAIVSPLALPACSAAGSATLLVPIVGGLVGSTLGVGDSVNVADLVLTGIGPLFVVCGTLPSSPGTHCSLDANIAALWPAQLSGFGVVAPAVVGDVVDAVDAILALAGQPPAPQVVQALQCEVPDAAGAITAPAAPPPAGDLPLPFAPVDSVGGLAPPETVGLPSLSVGVPSTPTPPVEVPVVGALVSTIDEHVPGGVHALQVIAAVLLALCLLRSWYTSWRLVRLDDKGLA